MPAVVGVVPRGVQRFYTRYKKSSTDPPITHFRQKEPPPMRQIRHTKRAVPTAPTCNPIESDRGRVDDADHRQQHPDKMGRQ